MTLYARHRRRRAGFTLIELLTVVAIISLLIGILLPSLSRARDQAKKATVAGMLSAIDKSLEMFHNDFKQYPDSRLRRDPITGWNIPDVSTQPEDKRYLTGAHWLARALVGHDYGGVDANGYVLQGAATLADLDPPLTYSELKDGRYAERRPIYMEGEIFARDDNTERFPGSGGSFERKRRMVVVDDAYDSPVLYYRANVRAQEPFCVNGVDDLLGTYRLEDNERITGKKIESGGPVGAPLTGWDFADVGAMPDEPFHPIGAYVDWKTEDIHEYPGSFTDYLHSHSAHKTSGRIRPYNAEKFILISAGKDGRFGTNDDITNFKSGL